MATKSRGIGAAGRALTGTAAWPGSDVEPVFDEPWEGRSFGLALSLVDGLGLSWDDFRVELIAAIESDPSRPYYESWMLALERLVTEQTAIDADELSRHRGRAAAYRYLETGTGDVEVFPIATEAQVLLAFLTDLFTGWWEMIRVGPLLPDGDDGLRFERRPHLRMRDGWLTVDDDTVRLDLCIGPQPGPFANPAATDIAQRARCRHAELYRLWIEGSPSFWGFRMFDGDEHEQLTVLLPSPFLDADDSPVSDPDWDQLECWDALRARYLGLSADPADRSGRRFRPG